MSKVVPYAKMLLDALFLIVLAFSVWGLTTLGLIVFVVSLVKVAPFTTSIVAILIAGSVCRYVWSKRATYFEVKL